MPFESAAQILESVGIGENTSIHLAGISCYSVCFSLFETCPLYCPAGEHSSCFENNKLSNGSSSKIRHCSQFLSVDALKLNEKVEYPERPLKCLKKVRVVCQSQELFNF